MCTFNKIIQLIRLKKNKLLQVMFKINIETEILYYIPYQYPYYIPTIKYIPIHPIIIQDLNESKDCINVD